MVTGVQTCALPIFRDWLFVEDHVEALLCVIAKGEVGENYNIGGVNERRNLEVVETICDLVDEMAPKAGRRRDLVTFVQDRPGHDQRYAIDCAKIQRELGWQPKETFESGLRKTVRWYLDNRPWWEAIRAGTYQGQRLGIAV